MSTLDRDVILCHPSTLPTMTPGSEYTQAMKGPAGFTLWGMPYTIYEAKGVAASKRYAKGNRYSPVNSLRETGPRET